MQKTFKPLAYGHHNALPYERIQRTLQICPQNLCNRVQCESRMFVAYLDNCISNVLDTAYIAHEYRLNVSKLRPTNKRYAKAFGWKAFTESALTSIPFGNQQRQTALL